MTESYHPPGARKSALIGAAVALAAAVAGPVAAQTPKDCAVLGSGEPAIVHEGRYNILCIRPAPGPFAPACSVEGVAGASRLAIHPLAIDGAGPAILPVDGDGPLPVPIDGTAGRDAYLFFSYDGPLDPIRDRYTLTCRW